MLLETIHIDNAVKFEHSEVINSNVTDNNAIGATVSTTLRTLSFEPANDNSIFVSKTGNDSTGDGTIETPYLTIKYAVSQCTATKTYVVINDTGLYFEQPMIILVTDFCVGIVANIGCAPTVSLAENLTEFKFITTLPAGITSLDGESPVGVNEREIDFGAYDGVNSIMSYAPIPLIDGTWGVPYIKGSDLRYRIYDKSFTIPLSDVLVKAGLSTNVSITDIVPFCATDDYVVVAMYTSPNYEHIRFNKNTGALIFYGYNSQSYSVPQHITGNIIGCRGAYSGSTSFYVLELTSANDWGTLKATATGSYSAHCYFGVFNNSAYVNFTYSLVGKIDLSTWAVTYLSFPSAWGTGANAPYGVRGFKYGTDYYMIRDINKIYKVDNFENFNITATYTPPESLTNFSLRGANYYHFYYTCQLDSCKIMISGYTASANYIFIYNFSKWGIAGFVYDKITITAMDTPLNIAPFISIGNNKFVSNSGGTPIGAQILSIFNRGIRINELFETNLLNTAKPCLVDGIIFDLKEDGRLKDLIVTSEDITLSQCTIKDILNVPYGIKFDSYILSVTANKTVLIQNCLVNDVDNGFKVLSDTVVFKYNIATRCKNSPVLEITGSGAEIIINNNTLHNNYAGFNLIENAGTEIIKNNILYYNTVYGIQAAITLQILNSCCPDTLIVVTLHSSSNALNPLFKNDGFINPDQLDVHLQSNYEGYTVNSPALVIGDDEKDAGCYDTTAVLAPPTYTTFYAPKPKKIGITLSPVGEIFNTMQDGSVSNRVDAFQLNVDFDWDSLKAMYIKDFVNMIMKGGEVRIYFSPYTDESMFESYYLKYKDYPFLNDLYSLAEYGYKDLKLSFARKFEIEELAQ